MSRSDLDVYTEIGRRLANISFDVVLDVGANVGQSTKAFRALFPKATIWSCEPVQQSFDALYAATKADPRTNPVKLAFGARGGQVQMLSRGTSPGNRILPKASNTQDAEIVTMCRGDDFMDENSIRFINYLKIDTEGHDIEVLKGFTRALSENRIDLVQIETGINPQNLGHVSFERAKTVMEFFNYYLFSLVDITFETRGRPHLRRWDSIFVSQSAIERNTAAPAS